MTDIAATEAPSPRIGIAHLPHVRAVFDALEAVRPGATRMVGGYVRDALLRRSSGDVDMASALLPEVVMEAARAAGLKAIPTGIAHGTVTLVHDGKPVEVTTLRRDVATDGRHAEVAFTEDWAADAARRDFTMNTLYADAEGWVHDPLGCGVADARAGRLRFVGEPAARIAEDYLRVLRFFRFAASHGRGPLDPAALSACANAVNAMGGLSVERVWAELKRLLAADDPRDALRAMAATGVLGAVLPEASGLETFDSLVDLDATLFLEPDPLQRLMAMLPRERSVVSALANRLRLSRAESDRLQAWAADDTRIVSFLSAREVRVNLYWMGGSLWRDRVRIAWASDREPRRDSQWRALLALEAGFVPPRFPLDGQQILAAGARPGPAVGEILREAERWWADADFTDDRLSLAERVKALVQALG